MYGTKAMEYALEGKNSILVTYRGGKIGYVTLDEVVRKKYKNRGSITEILKKVILKKLKRRKKYYVKRI